MAGLLLMIIGMKHFWDQRNYRSTHEENENVQSQMKEVIQQTAK